MGLLGFIDEENNEEDEQTFSDTVMENGSLIAILNRYSTFQEFLRRQECIHLRGITIPTDTQDVWLKFKDDIDGCVIETENFEAIKIQLRHLTLMPNERGDIRHLKHLLKKHVDLKKFSKSELRNFDRSVGFQLFYEEGWEAYVGLIPTTANGNV